LSCSPAEQARFTFHSVRSGPPWPFLRIGLWFHEHGESVRRDDHSVAHSADCLAARVDSSIFFAVATLCVGGAVPWLFVDPSKGLDLPTAQLKQSNQKIKLQKTD